MVQESSAPVVRAPLAAPPGYSSPASLINSPKSIGDDGSQPQRTMVGEWRASPRWAAVQGDGCIEVQPAEGEAGQVRVENCAKDVRAGPHDDALALPPN